MIVLIPGSKYQLENLNGEHDITLYFQEGMVGEKSSKNGTTNEELIAVLLDRLQHQNKECRSRETSLAITKIEEALMWLNKRTEDRISRGVLGSKKE